MTRGKKYNRIKFLTIIFFSVINYAMSQVLLPDSIRKSLDSTYGYDSTTLRITINQWGAAVLTEKNTNPKIIDIGKVYVDIFKEKYYVTNDNYVYESILAHEYGHLMQQKKNLEWFESPDSKVKLLRELQSDFMAGYFLANKYKTIFMGTKNPTEKEIFSEICKFTKSRDSRPPLYLMVAMLMNNHSVGDGSQDFTMQEYGVNPPTLRMLRISSLWHGFRYSSVSTIGEVYDLGRDLSLKLIENPNTDGRFKVFNRIGAENIECVLTGDEDCSYKKFLKRIETLLINANASEIKPLEKAYFIAMIKRNRNICN